jgi:hypothetical protein
MTTWLLSKPQPQAQMAFATKSQVVISPRAVVNTWLWDGAPLLLVALKREYPPGVFCRLMSPSVGTGLAVAGV